MNGSASIARAGIIMVGIEIAWVVMGHSMVARVRAGGEVPASHRLDIMLKNTHAKVND
jgi:hypothetical protein